MINENALRQEIRRSLENARGRIRGYTGLYPNEDLVRDVLRACDETAMLVVPDHRFDEARRIVEERCRRLAQVTDRFAERDPVLIGTSRAQAVAAVDVLQDVLLDFHRRRAPVPRLGELLRKKGF